MISDQTEKYTLIKANENSIEEFVITFDKNYSNFEGDHLIIDFSEIINTKIEDLNLILDISSNHRENGTSFVAILDGIDIDEIPEEINVVPTLTEALDILEMDEIERDLGF